MKIILFVEGLTETAVKGKLKEFLDQRCQEQSRPRVGLVTRPLGTRLLRPDELKFRVERALSDPEVLCVLALIDVYPNFDSAQAAKVFLQQAVGHDPRFHAHAAQFEFEAWLLPFWNDICRKLRVQRRPPGANPETIDLERPPSHHLKALYRAANPPRTYDKPRDARAILQDQDLTVIADQCLEFRSFLNSLLACAGLRRLPE